MGRLRYSIGSLLVLVMVLAVAFAALRQATPLWDSATFSTILGLLLVGTLLAIHREGVRRAYWVGFVLCGGSYLVLSILPWTEPRLVTSRGLAYLDSLRPGREGESEQALTAIYGTRMGLPTERLWKVIASNSTQANDPVASVWIKRLVSAGVVPASQSDPESFARIGHAFVALLAAAVGGTVSRRLWSSRQRPAAAAGGPDPIHGEVPV